MKNIRIAITDDDSLIVSLLQGYLHSCDGMEVLFTTNNGTDLLSRLASDAVLPDILLLDLKMQGMDGIEVTNHLKADYPDIKVIVVSSHYQLSFMGFMLKTGVSAFLPKGISPIELVDVIRIVDRQGYYFKEDQLAAVRGQISSKTPKPALDEDDSLSEREIEVLRLICQQMTAKEIGEVLFLTPRTVEGHKTTLFAKTGAKNIAGLVIYAIQHGFIRVDELPVM
ncbi:DNA-binding response regulator [Flavobacterium album]|uniref:DNA-binding response regulator n=1 Tax=Flavobacterium album TaxID=2175091 RepID=A0A2S1QTR2_9FLAO|nr:response regulator transcription factor [Flavobacterium album]AWH83764.1 DNA-binding response regulator [Flavobacterium album]